MAARGDHGPLTVLFDLTILATDARVRGIGRYVCELARALGRLCDPSLRIRFLERIGFDGRAVIDDDATTALERLMDPRRREALRWSWSYRTRLGMAGALAQAGADVLHLPHSGATPLRLHGVRRVVTCHDLIPLRFPQHYLGWRDGYLVGRSWLDRRRFHGADHVIAISEATARDLVDLLGVPRSKITTVAHGIDPAAWSARPTASDERWVRALGLEPRRYLLYVGDADWRKNHQGMLQALARVERHELLLACAGRLSPARRSAILKAAHGLGVADRVVLLDHVDDERLRALYRQALATLLVSRAEGFGLPVLEALASGSPVVTSNCSSMPEVAGDAALLVDPGDSASIAAAIGRLADDASLQRRLREAGPPRAARFGHARTAERTAAVYRAVGAC
jgi:glycosyltransferase involved in cell wall biosynthesis